MAEIEEFFSSCDWCGKPICFGNALVTIDRNIEQVDREGPEGTITVIQSHVLLTLCAKCGNGLDDEVIIDALLALHHDPLAALRLLGSSEQGGDGKVDRLSDCAVQRDVRLFDTVPAELRDKIKAQTAIEAAFGAGPSCIAGEVKKFGRPTDLSAALEWLEAHRHSFRRAHVMLADRTTLWFDPTGFLRHEDVPRENPPLPVAEVDTVEDGVCGAREESDPTEI